MTNHHLSVDIETYSDVDIKKAGLYKYAQSPAFDILLIAWAVDTGSVRIVDLTVEPGSEGEGRNYQALLDFIHDLYDTANTLHAYNAAFEHYCINTWLARQGRPEIPLSRWRCTMAQGNYCGYPAGLAAIGEAMGLPRDKRKLGIGSALIRKFCVPQKPNRTHPEPWRVRPQDEPEKWELFKTYCRQDVETERTVGRMLARWPMPEKEQHIWELTTAGNILGVGVDTGLAENAIAVGETEQAELMAEARAISGLDNPKSTQQLMKWLNTEIDEEVTDLRKTTVAELLKAGVDSAKAERMLELRQLISKTSTTKYNALEAATCGDGRVRGMMAYYGASRTGRWAGRLVQPQNLPQNHLDDLDAARRLVNDRDIEMIRLCWGSVPDTLSQLIRTALIPAPGKIYAVADYSAIEARVVAWLAGEQWVLDAFRAGKDIYCAMASMMFRVPVEKHGQNAHLRQRGKVAVLGCGYGSGPPGLINAGALRQGLKEEDLPVIVSKWRAANPMICKLWRRVEEAAVSTVETGQVSGVRIKGTDATLVFKLEADGDQRFLTVRLPSGRQLFYAQPFLAPAKKFADRESLHYYHMNQQTRKWGPTDTWGGKLVENITQAVARDCLAETLIALDKAGLPVVFHVHDEVICEVDDPDRLQEILDIMAAPVPWAPGLPLKGAGFTCHYYQKD